jgi:hypothetical protein
MKENQIPEGVSIMTSEGKEILENQRRDEVTTEILLETNSLFVLHLSHGYYYDDDDYD